MTGQPIRPDGGMFFHLIERVRPELAKRIRKTGRIETAVVGLGSQGSRHAELMRRYGTPVTAGVAPGRGGSRLHETIPVYDSIAGCLEKHPDIAAASIWRHYSSVRETAVETIEAGIPVVVLITEGIPLKDVRDIITAARRHDTLLFGGNTPGIIFPPERLKIGMLPDVFQPEEKEEGKTGPGGVTILSRSGAILYHMSDAMASAGIAQNAVLGIGGDGAAGSTFRDLVPLVMAWEHTDLVIVAGEIGGCQEEVLARDMEEHPGKYPKPLVALISGAHAPAGKTMGHAGAIVNPGMETGTFASKKRAFQAAGVPVVNSQHDLIRAVQEKLAGRTYFRPERYYDKMKQIWEAPPPRRGWTTCVSKIARDEILIRGYPIQELIGSLSLIGAAHLTVQGELPDEKTLGSLSGLAMLAARLPVQPLKTAANEDISKTLIRHLLNDTDLADFSPGEGSAWPAKTAFCLGRVLAYIASITGVRERLAGGDSRTPFTRALGTVISPGGTSDAKRDRLVEAMIVACVDHGVTPPSVQAALIAASVRASYEVAVAQGVGAITDVHGGAGQKASLFYGECVRLSGARGIPPEDAAREVMAACMSRGGRIEGMGHRLHREDPRRDILWKLAEEAGIAGPAVAVSKAASRIFREVRGIDLPLNVDGVIGAITSDLDLDPRLAKAIFVFGRIAGLSAHYVEEITTQPPMRPIHFGEASYGGPELRHIGT